MRRIFLVSTLMAGLLTGFGSSVTSASAAAGAPAGTVISTSAAMGEATGVTAGARARVKAVVTSLSGRPILLVRGIIRCTSTRTPDSCGNWDWAELQTQRYQRTVQVKRTAVAGLVFASDHRFRMRIYVNGVKRHDRKARWYAYGASGAWIRGFLYFGPGAINLI